MIFFKTIHERKSATITSMIIIIILIFLSFIGLKYYDPPISYGMEVNFGNSSLGKDNNQTEKPNVLKIQNLKTETNNFAREKPIKKSENIITQKELSEKINIKKLKIEFKRDTKFNENLSKFTKPRKNSYF